MAYNPPPPLDPSLVYAKLPTPDGPFTGEQLAERREMFDAGLKIPELVDEGFDANGSPTAEFPGYPAEGVWQPDVKPTNPKDAIGSKKLAMHLVPDTLTAYAALAFTEGALKYGKYNWRVAGVRASIYLDAIGRHLAKFTNGENEDPQTGVPHLASIIACAGILLDADLCGKLTDDRPPRADVSGLIDDLAASTQYLQELFAGHTPHQHTIEDEDYQP